MQFGWVDFSKEDREKVLDVVNMLQEPGAVDELGIGTIRDAFAGVFFPGTSTVQTKAKYYLIVPYVIKEALDGKYGDDISKILRKIDEEEKQCALILLQNCPSADGIIGKRNLPKKWVSRRPSNIYLNGIKTFQIFQMADLSIADMVKASCMLRKDSSLLAQSVKRGSKQDEDSDDIDAGFSGYHKFISLPTPFDEKWRDNLNIELSALEADFLREQILKSVPDSLLSYVLKKNIDLSQYQSFEAFCETHMEQVSDAMKEFMSLACAFNNLVYALRVRYNYILSDGENPDAVNEWDIIRADLGAYSDVDLDRIYTVLFINDPRTKHFLKLSQEAMQKNDIEGLDNLIIMREKSLKGPARAKLLNKDKFDTLKWTGGKRLDYRFVVAQNLITDIRKGEGK